MEHPGLLSWANSVRLTMASDPGRQAFKDQVQTIGFLFLDDYLDNIVSGAKQDPLIELVKTPGRKKAISRKPKIANSKLGDVVSFEDNIEIENVAPMNNLHKALLSVKAEKSLANSSGSNKFAEEKTQRGALLAIQPGSHNMTQVAENTLSYAQAPSVPQSTLAPPIPAEHNDLSIIAEDDEPSERVRPSAHGHIVPNTPLHIASPDIPPAEVHIRELSPGEAPNTSARHREIGSNTSPDASHSVPLHHPSEHDTAQMDGTRGLAVVGPEQMAVDEDTGPVPQEKLSNDLQDHRMSDIEDYDATSSFPKTSERAGPAPSFPALPEPMPLRKSIRVRDPSLSTVMLGAATPGTTTKRTSWLAKAREVKALEVTTKKPHIPSLPALPSTFASAVHQPHGTKRKSEEMLVGAHEPRNQEERPQKVAKITEGETAPHKSKEEPATSSETLAILEANVSQPEEGTTIDLNTSQEGVLRMLKKTVQGLGVRGGKSMGKSLGGGAANALAEAKAAAEARLAERDRKEEMTLAMDLVVKSSGSQNGDAAAPSGSSKLNEGRLSVSDLFPKDGRIKEKHRAPEKVSHTATLPVDAHMSTSTTPPHSPSSTKWNSAQPAASVFTKPPPVFVPPVHTYSNQAEAPVPKTVFAFRPPSPPKSFGSTSAALGLGTRLQSTSPNSKSPRPLTAHSTLESLQSEKIFDDNDDGVAAWMPSTQGTEYTSAYESHPPSQICDEDDSWPVDEKLAAGVQWTYGVSKEDSMTWSTLPSQSQRADTGPVARTSPIREEGSVLDMGKSRLIPGGFDEAMEMEDDMQDNLIPRDMELEEIMLSSKSTVSLVKQAEPARSQSQMSLASSESSQSQTGFFGQASKFLSTALGKKKQPEVKKVLQKAAVAAKKQQEETDKKAVRLKEMEMRRQQAIQRKTDEEKAKALEEERKMKEDAERRKREREEQTDKRPFKPTASKRDDDTKKKKIESAEKKPELKKPAPSIILGKSNLKSALKQPAASSSVAYSTFTQAIASSSTMTYEPTKTEHGASASLQKSKSQAPSKMMIDDELSQPSQLVQSQMAARAKAQIEASKPALPSESIELPDINSEYSDSDDEDRPRTFDPPEWAQSPELRQALLQQSTINPDDIFGAVRPLKMEEIFKTRTSRFRARTSSANWTGSDRLTIQEELEYARRMGFK